MSKNIKSMRIWDLRIHTKQRWEQLKAHPNVTPSVGQAIEQLLGYHSCIKNTLYAVNILLDGIEQGNLIDVRKL